MKQPDERGLWGEIGFHRVIGGFWFKLIVSILELFISIIVNALLFNIIFPFPERIGYRTTAMGLFSFMFVVFDLGTCATIDRFVAEAYNKNPKKMVQYVQYFI